MSISTPTRKLSIASVAVLLLTGSLIAGSATAANAYPVLAPTMQFSTATPAAGAGVEVEVRNLEPGASYAIKVGSAAGVANATSFTAPSLAGKYTVRLVITSGADLGEVSERTITVGTIISKVTIDGPDSIKSGKSATFTGSIGAKKAGAIVKLQYSNSKSGTFKDLSGSSTTTYSSGSYSVTHKFANKATFYIRAVVVANGKFTGATSSVITFKVK